MIVTLKVLLLSRSVVSDSWQPHGLQHARLLFFSNSQSLFKHNHFCLDMDMMPSKHHILCRPLLLLPSVFSSIKVFSSVSVLHIRWPSIGASVSASGLPMNIQDWFPLRLTSLISLQSKGLSRVFSNTTVEKINFLVLCFLYGPTVTSIHDYWKNHNFDYMDLCWQSNVSAF